MRASMPDEPGREGGVTLLELMVGLFLTALLMVGVLALWQQTQRAYFHGAEAADLQQNLRVGLERMVRVIQAAGTNPKNKEFHTLPWSPNDPAFVAFREAGTRCLRLYADLNGDGDVGDTDENVYFNWSGTNGDPLSLESGGGPDAGQPWVTASTGTEELALGIIANPGATAMFQYFTGPNDAAPNTQLPAGLGACGNLTDANRARIGRIVITLTGRATAAGQTFTKTLVSEARPRNVP